MRISDWSSDVCSSDLRGSRKKATWRRLRSSQGHPLPAAVATAASPLQRRLQQPADESLRARCLRVVVGVRGFVHVDALAGFQLHRFDAIDRKRVVWGKSVSVRVDPGGRRFIRKKKAKKQNK